MFPEPSFEDFLSVLDTSSASWPHDPATPDTSVQSAPPFSAYGGEEDFGFIHPRWNDYFDGALTQPQDGTPEPLDPRPSTSSPEPHDDTAANWQGPLEVPPTMIAPFRMAAAALETEPAELDPWSQFAENWELQSMLAGPSQNMAGSSRSAGVVDSSSGTRTDTGYPSTSHSHPLPLGNLNFFGTQNPPLESLPTPPSHLDGPGRPDLVSNTFFAGAVAQASYPVQNGVYTFPAIAHDRPESSTAVNQRLFVNDAVADPRAFTFSFPHDFGYHQCSVPLPPHYSFPTPATAGVPSRAQYMPTAGPSTANLSVPATSGVLHDAPWVNVTDAAPSVHSNTPQTSTAESYLPPSRFHAEFVNSGVLCERHFTCSWRDCSTQLQIDLASCQDDEEFQRAVAKHIQGHEVDSYKASLESLDKKLACLLGDCTEHLGGRKALTRHIRTKFHGLVWCFFCPICAARFPRKDLLQKHMKVCGNATPFPNENTPTQVAAGPRMAGTKRGRRVEAPRPSKRRKTEQ